MAKKQSLTYPTVTPDVLSPDARHVYDAAIKKNGHLNSDPFDPAFGRTYVRPGTDWTPDARTKAAIKEITGHRLGRWSKHGSTLYVERVHPAYTVAKGDGQWYVEARLLPLRSGGFIGHPSEGPLLAVLVGATLNTRTDLNHNTPTLFVKTASDTVRAQGSLMKTASLEILTPLVEFSDYGQHRITGTLIEANLYPLGIDPIERDEDGEYGEDEYPPVVEHTTLPLPQMVSLTAYALGGHFKVGKH